MNQRDIQHLIAAARRVPFLSDRAAPAPTYSDEHIERCARLYLDNPVIRLRGILFETFLSVPGEIMRAIADGMSSPVPDGEEYLPLLPPQISVRARLDREARDREIDAQLAALERLIAAKRMRVSDGCAIESLHHRVWPRHQARRDHLAGSE